MGMIIMLVGCAFEKAVFALPRAKVTPAEVALLGAGLEKRYFGPLKFSQSYVYKPVKQSYEATADGSTYERNMEMFYPFTSVASEGSEADRRHSKWMKLSLKRDVAEGKASFFFPPMINLNPGSASEGYSSVLSAMLQALKVYKSMGIDKFQIAFDLPLYLKAMIIKEWAGQLDVHGRPNHAELAKFHVVLGSDQNASRGPTQPRPS